MMIPKKSRMIILMKMTVNMNMNRFFIFDSLEEFNNAYADLPKPNVAMCKGL